MAGIRMGEIHDILTPAFPATRSRGRIPPGNLVAKGLGRRVRRLRRIDDVAMGWPEESTTPDVPSSGLYQPAPAKAASVRHWSLRELRCWPPRSRLKR